MIKPTQRILFAFLILFLALPAFAQLNLDRLADPDIRKVKDLIHKLEPLIKDRDKKQNLATLTFEELYAPLDQEQKALLKQFEDLDPKELKTKILYRGMATGKEELVVLTGQKVKVRDKKKEGTDKDIRELSPVFLPPQVHARYLKMMEAMHKDLGKRLLVESGYRSSAYQLYLLVFYLSNHDYSIRETVKFVALPGFSEHGSSEHQALDFINADGINGEDNPAEFEALAEYKWLLKNAGRFSFELSYPKTGNKDITFEPWHWRIKAEQPHGNRPKSSKKPKAQI